MSATQGTALLQIEGLSIPIPGDGDRAFAVQGIDLTLHAGEILCVVGEWFPHLSLGAMAEDIQLGLEYLRDMHRVAVVTDSPALTRLAPIASALVPGEVKSWRAGQRDAALAWLQQ